MGGGVVVCSCCCCCEQPDFWRWNNSRVKEGRMGKEEEPAVGIPYAYPASAPAAQQPNLYYVGHNPYQAGMIPPNAIYGDPKGIPLLQTMYRDTPAPFQCVYCANSGLTNVKSVSYFLSFFLLLLILVIIDLDIASWIDYYVLMPPLL